MGGKVGTKLEKTVILPGKAGIAVPILSWKGRTPFLHIFLPKLLFLLLKMSHQIQKTIILTFFQTLPQICTSPSPNFFWKILNLIIPPYMYIIDVRLYKVWPKFGGGGGGGGGGG